MRVKPRWYRDHFAPDSMSGVLFFQEVIITVTEDIIRLEGVGKVFKTPDAQIRALNNINLSIHKGEIFGIIGLSGAGKSTLVRCINLLEKPSEGFVYVNGQDILSLSAQELRAARRSIGMIFQGFNLLMQKNVLDNVCFPMLLVGTGSAAAREKAMELLKIVGLEDKAKAFPAQLSGGQKQRVAIARALTTDPSIILCDEATSALDPTTTKSILDLLQKLNREMGVTVVVITHEMKVVEAICDRVAILADSEVAEMGSVEDIFRHPKTAAARKLILPKAEEPDAIALGGGRYIRLVFAGQSANEPIVSQMVLESGYPVNIVYADTKSVQGKIFGVMIVERPEDEQHAAALYTYLKKVNVQYEEVQ